MAIWVAECRLLAKRLLGWGGLWLLFALPIAGLGRNPAMQALLFRAYLALLPLLAALFAPALVLGDPALELLLTTPRRPIRWILRRVALLWLLGAGSALLLHGVALAASGRHLALVPVWATWAPMVALSAVALLLALLGTESMMGAAVAGVLWFGQIISARWFLSERWLADLSLFLGLFGDYPWNLPEQMAVMGLIGLLCLAGAALLLRVEERYL